MHATALYIEPLHNSSHNSSKRVHTEDYYLEFRVCSNPFPNYEQYK